MERLLVLAVIIALANCAAPPRPAQPSQAADATPAAAQASEPAPVVRGSDYRVSPDARERLCNDSQLVSRDNSFGMLTKTSTSYYCF